MNRMKGNKYTIISINAEKAFNKIHYLFMIRTLSSLDTEEHTLTY